MSVERGILNKMRASAQIILEEVDNLQIFVVNRNPDDDDRRTAYGKVKTIKKQTWGILATDNGGVGGDLAVANMGLLNALLDEVICGETGTMTARARQELLSKLAKSCEAVHAGAGLKAVMPGEAA